MVDFICFFFFCDFGCKEQEWTQLWVQGDIASNAAGLREREVLMTLRRPGGKFRQIALTEALVKLAEGVMIDAVFKTSANIFEAQQFSESTAGGAEAVMGALGQRSTRGAVVATDLTNAYGCMSRQCALEAASTHCPRTLGILCTKWERGSTTAWLRTPDGWTEWNVERRTWQGALAANPTFYLALHQAAEEARKKAEGAGAGG